MSKHASFKITPVWGGRQLPFVVLFLEGNISFGCMETRCAGIVGCYSVIVEPSC